jgi:hypothetical protein
MRRHRHSALRAQNDTSGKAQRGLFTKADFVYDANHDHTPARQESI